jgi:hypothetical protein
MSVALTSAPGLRSLVQVAGRLVHGPMGHAPSRQVGGHLVRLAQHDAIAPGAAGLGPEELHRLAEGLGANGEDARLGERALRARDGDDLDLSRIPWGERMKRQKL